MTLVTRPAMTDDTGEGQSGTVVSEAFVDLLLDQIDDQNHSTTNTTIKPKATTDEVKTARGTMGSLDARLDVSLNEDGTLKDSAQAVTLAQVKSQIGSINCVKNGELDDWSAGAAAAPDDFTLSVITVARVATSLNAGQYMARLTRAGADGFLYQDIIAAADFANNGLIAELGLEFSFSLRVKTSIASHCRITVDDGVTTTSSSYHTGGGADETLTVVHTISASATRLRIRADVNNSNGDADVGGFIAGFSELAIASWKPLTLPPVATATRRGLVSTLAQTFAGLKTGSFDFAALPTGIGGIKYARCTASLTKNASETYGDVTGLAFTVAANETWAFFFVVQLTTTAAASIKMTLTGPAAPTAVRYGTTLNAVVAGANGHVTAFGSNIVDSGSAAPTGHTNIVAGLLRNGANAGTVQLQAAQFASEATNTVVHENSFVIAIRVG